MFFGNWRNAVKPASGASDTVRRRPGRNQRFRPELVQLEARCVPATVHVTAPTEANLLAALNAATPGDTVDFQIAPGSTIGLNNQNPAGSGSFFVINKNLTIDASALGAAGVDLHRGGAALYRIFEVTSNAQVTLKNLTFSNGAGAGGGALLVTSGSATVTGSTFTGNASSLGGGAIEGKSGTQLTVTTSSFSNNQAGTSGGAIAANGSLTAIFNRFVSNSTPAVQSEIQTVTLTGAGMSGNFTLSGLGTTMTVTVGDSAATVQANLNAALKANNPSLANSVLVVGSSGPGGGGYSISFTGALANANVDQFTATAGTLTGGSVSTSTATQGFGNEVQSLTFAGTTGGSYTVNFGGPSSSSQNFTTASASTLQSAIESLVGAGNVVVAGTNAAGYRIFFQGALALSDVPQMAVQGSFLVPANSAFTGTAAPGGGNGQAIFAAGAADADDNWWGSNAGPGSNDVVGVAVADWLTLIESAAAPAIGVGQSTVFTASITGLHGGGTTAAGNLNGLPAFPVPAGTIFSNPVNGTLSGSGTQLVNGAASTTFLATAEGTGSVDASADNQAVTANVIIDSTAPTSAITTPSPAGQFFSQNTNPAGLGISGTATDGSGSGVNNVVLYITNGAGQYWNGSAFVAAQTSVTATGTTNWSYTFTGVTSPDGLYTVQSVAIDNAGNVQTTTVTTTFNLDNTAPTSSITFPAGGASYDLTTYTDSITGTAADPGASPSGVQQVGVSILQVSTGRYWDGSSFGNATEQFFTATGTTGWSLSFPGSNFSVAGNYTFHSVATDNAGNVQSAGGLSTAFINPIIPVPPAITSANSTTFTAGTAGTFTVTATGLPAPTFSLSGAPAWLSIDSNTGVLSGTPIALGPFQFTITASNGALPDATQRFTLTVNPAATVYVDQSFAGTPAGQNPATAPTGLTLHFGADAFADVQTALANVAAGGTVVIFADNTPYAGFTVNVPVTFAVNQNPQNPSGGGLVVISDPVTLNQDTVFTQAAIQPGTNPLGPAALEFDGNIVAGGTPVSLTVNGNTSQDRFQAVGTTANPLSLFNVASSGLVILQQDVATAGAQTYNAPVQVEEVGTLTLTATTVQFGGSVTSNVRHGNLTVAGAAAFNGAVGGSGNDLTDLRVTAATTIGAASVETGGAQTYAGAVTLAADVALASTANGAITFGGTVQSSGAARALTVNTGGATVFHGAVGGGGHTLGALTTNAGGVTRLNGGAVNTSGFAQNYNDDVTLGSAFTLLAAVVNFNAGLTLGATATTATSALQVAGTLNFTNTTTVTTTFAGTAPSQVGHILVGGGNATYGNATLALNYSGFTPTAGNAFDVVSNGGFGIGQFVNAPAPGPVTLNGTPYLVTYAGTAGGGDFVLTVAQAPAVTSANNTTFAAGAAGSFTVTATGNPAPTFGLTGAPAWLSIGSTTGVITGTPPDLGAGPYTFTFTVTAGNGVAPAATQNFTLTVNQAPAITSANGTTFTTGSAGTFTFTATGNPAPTLRLVGTLPAGVTFNAATGVLSGTPAAGTGGSYALTFSASNGVGAAATQPFTLTVNQGPQFTSPAAALFFVGQAATFTVQTTGAPTPALTETGTLPPGVQFHDNGDGTATLAGTPAAAGSFAFTITADSGAGLTATQSFTLTVVPAQGRFVEALYREELGRSANFLVADDGNLWVNALVSGTLTQAQVAAAVQGSLEARTYHVDSWYQYFLGRQAQGGEEAGWVTLLGAGAKEELVLSGLLGSAEYLSHAQTVAPGGTPQQDFVQSLYKLLLHRSGSAGEVAGWFGLLNTFGQRDVAFGFLKSTEYRTDVVNDLYAHLLHRAPSPQELDAWVFSTLDLRTIRLQFESSPEFP